MWSSRQGRYFATQLALPTCPELLGAPTAHPSSGYNNEPYTPASSVNPVASLNDSTNYHSNASKGDVEGATKTYESTSPQQPEATEEEKKEMIRKRRELAKQRLEERKKQVEVTGPEGQKRARVN